MRTRPFGLAMAVLLLMMAATSAWSAESRVAKSRVARPTRQQRAGKVQDQDFSRRIDVNTINMFTTNIGSTAWDLNSGNAGLYWPKGTTNTSVFAAGLWLAGKVGSSTRMAAAEYTQDYVPGPMEGGTFIPTNDPRQSDFVVYKVARFNGDPLDTAHVDRSDAETAADPTLDPLVHHSWSEYMRGAVPYGAPTRYWHLNPANPADSVLGPDVLGDQMLWTVYNDADPATHGGDFTPATQPLGIEVQQKTFGFNRTGPLANIVFIEYRLINKGSNTIDNMFVSQWCDPDLGGFTDDLVGCDTTLSVGYCYNATNRDATYGSRPPAEGFDFFLGPTNAAGDTLPMTSFNKYINGTDPASPTEVYQYMNGRVPDGSANGAPIVDPHGIVSNFFDAGDPVSPGPNDWLDTNPADRRFLMSSGPFTMVPGDTQKVVVGFIIGQGRDRLSAISAMRCADVLAQAAFDSSFDIPAPPPRPKVNVATNNGQVTLNWDTASRTNYNQPGYIFEGYNVYQGASQSGPWTLVATFDEVDQVRVIFDLVCDEATGFGLNLPVAFGSDQGVQFSYTATQDAVNGGPLHNGTAYYYAVTAYGFNPNGLPRVVENSPQSVRVIPQRPAAGTDLATASSTCPVHIEKDPSVNPKATTRASVEIVNADSVIAHTYKIGFGPLPSPTIVGSDSNVTIGWNLVDSTTTDTLLKNQTNLSGNDDYAVIRGMRVRVVGSRAPVPGMAEGAFLCLPEPKWPLAGYTAAGGEAFDGGLTEAANILGGLDPGTDPDSFVTVEVRFSHTQKQNVYRYLRLQLPDGSAPPAGRTYRYAGFLEQPFTVWDTDHNVQLDAAMVERANVDEDPAGNLLPPGQQTDTYDGLWNPNTDDNGGRELLVVVKSGYSSAPKAAYEADGAILGDLPSLFLLWSRRVSVDAHVNDGDVFRMLWNGEPPTSNDVFVYSTSPLVRNNATLARGRLSNVRAVPNPYYTRSRYELNQFGRVVRFVNLPEVCTIRVFNLAGELVRTIQKTDATTSTQDWDLLTENRLPVASGVYIFHVDAPGAGSTFGRMVIFMEKERLNSL